MKLSAQGNDQRGERRRIPAGVVRRRAYSIAGAAEEQSTTTRDIAESVHSAAQHTARASAEIESVERAVELGAAAVGDITAWTERLSSRANDLETKVANFFSRVRAA